METRTLALAELQVDPTNFRIGVFDTQRDAIKAMLDQQGAKIVELAEDIIDIGLNPSELLIVASNPEEDGFFLVCEGNRRLTALKVMETPLLAAGTELEDDFRELAVKFAKNPIRSVQCVVFEDKAAAMPWIARKHTNKQWGKGIERWDPEAQGRYEASIGEVRRSKAVMDYLRAEGAMTPAMDAGMRRKTTTADRVLNMPHFVSTLGVQFDRQTGAITFDNGDKDAGTALLSAILSRIAEPTFTVNDVRTLGQRLAFIDGFKPQATITPPARTSPSVSGAGGQPATSSPGSNPPSSGTPVGGMPSGGSSSNPPASGAGGPATPSGGTPTPGSGGTRPGKSSLDRKTLAPTSTALMFKVKDPRLNRIYQECRKIKVQELPNAAGMLLRVFVELSTDAYLDATGVPLPQKHTSHGRKNWSDIGINLPEKVRVAIAALDPTGKDKDLANARKAESDSDALHSIDTMHGYMHNPHAEPDELELKKSWERWYPYLRRLHAAII